MTGFAFPEILVAIDAAAQAGDLAAAHEIYSRYFRCVDISQTGRGAAAAMDVEISSRRVAATRLRFLPLMVFEQQPGVGVRKELYRLRGLLESPHVRHPAPQVSPVAAKGLADQIARSFPGVDIAKPLPATTFRSRPFGGETDTI